MLQNQFTKIAVAVAGVGAVFALSACGSSTQGTAHPAMTAQQTDDAFIQALVADNLPGTDGARKEYIALAHTECQALDAGNSVEAVLATGIQSGAPTFSPEDVGHIFGSAVRFYCPEYTDAVQRAAGTGGA